MQNSRPARVRAAVFRDDSERLFLVDCRQEAAQRASSLRVALENARALQDLRKDLSDLELDNVFGVVGVKFRVAL